jgi:hypothetical protein
VGPSAHAPWVTVPEKISEFKAIVFVMTDRVSRGTDEDFSRIEAWAADHEKKLIIVGPNGGIQYPARSDSDYWQWVSAKRQARTEWEAIRERTMRKTEDLIEAGRHVGRIPFGCITVGAKYQKDLVPTETGIKYTPLIFEHVADGWSLMRVCKWLDSEGVPTVTQVGQGRRRTEGWSPKSVAEIIRNRMYYTNERRSRKTGRLLNRLITDKPLVDAALWARANKRLDNAPVGRRGSSTKPTALLTGVLFCGNCGSPMYRNVPKVGQNNPWWTYYRCYGQLPQRKGCGVMVAIPFLDEEINQAMLRNRLPVLHRIFVTGDSHEVEQEEIRLRLLDLPNLGLSDDDEDAERARLRARRNELQNAKTEPSKWVDVAYTHAGEDIRDPVEWALRDDLVTHADEWRTADPGHKRELLKSWRITFAWSEDREPIVGMGPESF